MLNIKWNVQAIQFGNTCIKFWVSEEQFARDWNKFFDEILMKIFR
jgi:hypothetical protein